MQTAIFLIIHQTDILTLKKFEYQPDYVLNSKNNTITFCSLVLETRSVIVQCKTNIEKLFILMLSATLLSMKLMHNRGNIIRYSKVNYLSNM